MSSFQQPKLLQWEETSAFGICRTLWMCQVWVGAEGVISGRRFQMLPLCAAEPRLSSSATGQCSAGMTDLGREEKPWKCKSNCSQREEWEMGEEQPCRHKGREEGEAGGAPGTGAEIPCSPWGSTMEQGCTCSPGRSPAWSRDAPATREGVHDGGRGMFAEEALALQEAHTGTSSWQNSWREEPEVEQVCGDPMGDPSWSSLFLKDCTLWQEDTWKNPGAREENEGEGAAGAM